MIRPLVRICVRGLLDVRDLTCTLSGKSFYSINCYSEWEWKLMGYAMQRSHIEPGAGLH